MIKLASAPSSTTKMKLKTFPTTKKVKNKIKFPKAQKRNKLQPQFVIFMSVSKNIITEKSHNFISNSIVGFFSVTTTAQKSILENLKIWISNNNQKRKRKLVCVCVCEREKERKIFKLRKSSSVFFSHWYFFRILNFSSQKTSKKNISC